MFNVNELTSRLAKMSDPQLQQYAKIHKDDPYTLALAAAESKRRSQLRAGGQQQAAQQPTVADQALAQMGAPAPMPQQAQLPEQQGIGMLPAENVATMADGGIAGYGDSYADEYANGGIVAFAGKDGSVVRDAPYTSTSDTSAASYLSEGARRDLDKGEYRTSPIGRFFSFLTPDAYTTDTRNQLVDIDNKYSTLRNEYKKLTGAFGFRAQSPQEQARANELERQMAALEQQSSAIRSRPDATVRAMHEKQVAAAQPAPAATDKSPTPVETYRDITAPNTPKPTPKPKSGGPYSDSPAGRNAAANRPGAGTTTKDGKAGTTTASDFVPNKTTTLNAELERLEQFNPGVGQYDTLKNKLEEGYAKLQKERDESKPTGKAYAGLEALLGKEEEKAKGKEKQNLYMSMINAGLATMGGRSQYAMQNIAEGAQVGTKQYQEGVEKLEAAAVERRKQAALIEEARRAEARGDWKDAQQLKQQAFDAGITVERSKVDAVMNIWGVNQKTAVELTTSQNKMASDDARAQMQQREETKRADAQNRTSERVAQIYASMRASAGPSLADKAYDNATRQHQLWLNSPEGKVESLTPGASDRKFLQYLEQSNKALNITVPSSAAATTKDSYAGWGNVQVTPGK
jgi:hypothetical protein